MTNLRKSRGFSLVEVLIALVIMSIGMLGIAGLYVQSLQAGRTSMLRHHAVTLAGDVADRIRANPTAGAAYAAPAGMDNNCVAMSADCDVAEMAAHDIFLWQAQALEFLPPMGDGTQQVVVAHDDTVIPQTFTITIRWDEPTPDGIPPQYSFTVPVNTF
ncbi:MAG: type IV pilus modification protein PilV [Gammaproteobacteria bacterium]|nr:type IV pilus modification protein PilV [Gammaproteobacteria bacterium]